MDYATQTYVHLKIIPLLNKIYSGHIAITVSNKLTCDHENLTLTNEPLK